MRTSTLLPLRRGRCPHRPKGSYELTGDFRKNVADCRVDVGIAPYALKRFFKGIKKKGSAGSGTPFSYLLAVRLHAVQLSDGGMHVSFFPGKNASIGKAIWLKTSHGFSSAAPETFGQLLLGMQ